MMQNGGQSNAKGAKEVRTLEIEQGSQTPPLPSVENAQVGSSSQSNFGPDMSGSEDEEASEVESFILEENDIDDRDQESSKFLLPMESAEAQGLQTVDAETHARLEALLEAAGISKLSSKDGKALADPEVLRNLTSSVSSALDEAAQALHRMRSDQQQQVQLGVSENSRAFPEACGESDVGSVRKLYDGSNVPDSAEEGESLLSLACSAGYYELAQVLLAMKANVEDRGLKGDCTPLMEAASGGHVDIVKLLISHGADVNAQSSAGNTPLHYAACGGYKDVVEELISSGASVEVHNENGHTPLMEAASAGHVDVAKILLKSGAGINTHSNEFKESALTLACYKGHLDMVKFLLEAGADQEHKTDEMHTALMEASMDGHVEVARLLLDSGAQVNMPADSFESPLTLAACGGHVELASLLIERGANIEEVNDEGYTPLMEAAREGHEEMVALLLSNEADINAQTEETQETALTLACCGGFLEVADFLIKAGANIELGCSTPLMEAAQEGHLELVKYLIKSGANVHAQTGTGDTALTYACENGHTDVASVLLENGADLEHESEGGRTPLMKAARAGHLCTVQFLLSKNADVNRATTTNDHTVLSLACAGGHLNVVELLLNHSGDVNHRLKDGSTMIIEAAKGGHTSVVKLLLEWPNKVANLPADLTQLNPADPNLEERVPTQGLPHLVPPNEPDSQMVGGSSFAPNIQVKTSEQVRQNIQKTLAKRLNGQGETKSAKSSNTVIAETVQQLNHEGGLLADYPDEKATEKVEAILNTIMAKEIINSSSATKEEQILRKQQILEELQKVERELQEKAQAQLLLSAQQQLDQQQALAKIKTVAQTGKQVEDLIRKKQEGSGQAQGLVENLPVNLGSDLQFNLAANLLSAGDFGAAAQAVHPYTDTFLQQPFLTQGSGAAGTVSEGKGISGKTIVQSKRNGGSKISRSSKVKEQVQQSQQQQPQAPLVLNFPAEQYSAGSPPAEQPVPIPQSPIEAHQQLQVLAQQPMTFPQLPEQLLQQMFNSQALQQSLPTSQLPSPLVQATHNQQVVQNQPQGPQHVLTQQQQQQLYQQQQQAQLLQQLQQLKQPGSTIASKSQSHKQQRLIQNSSQQIVGQQNTSGLGVEPITPPPSTPMTPNPSPASPQSLTSFGTNMDVDAQTESNHDTALTLACAGGHAELVNLLLSKCADIEHRDKKGFTPLILAATAGHVDVVEILLDHHADIEAQSERTKDTPLSLACSGGRYDVVDLLLGRGANKEHRNVSDYTPLSLAASGGYVNIIKLLLSHGAEINSRTGSKLGISPLMLAAMNGHTAAVKLLLDMGSDINAQIETNRNTALTLACFQGRHEVVSLLVDRKANIEHRAKTGLTPLMEAASGGYVEVGRVLLDKGADVNAPPVPSSRDTALTIAADKGHYRFVELLLNRGAMVDVKNKKGNSPLWLACNGGHLDVVQLLVTAGADIDSQDNRKVSCLMAAFRKGHVKVVKWMVKHVAQFPSDQELQRYIATVADKDLQKKCQQCMEIIVSAKDRQAAEANKNATILLEEIDKERRVEESRKAAAAKKRERRKMKKKEKQEREKEKECNSKNSSPEPESADSSQNDMDKDEESVPIEPPTATTTSTTGQTLTTNSEAKISRSKLHKVHGNQATSPKSIESRKNKKNKSKDKELISEEKKARTLSPPLLPSVTTLVTVTATTAVVTSSSAVTATNINNNPGNNRKKKNDLLITAVSSTGISDLDDFGTIPSNLKISDREIDKLAKNVEKVKLNNGEHHEKANVDRHPVENSTNTLSLKVSPVITSPKRGQKKEDGWKEVIRRSRRVQVPASSISRVIGRGGCNINTIREVSGAHCEVEKSKGSGDRFINIRGSSEATKQAFLLITALSENPDKDMSEILSLYKLKLPEKNPVHPPPPSASDMVIGTFNPNSIGSSQSPQLPSPGSGSVGKSPASSKGASGRQSGSTQVHSTPAKTIPVTSQVAWQNQPQINQLSPRRSPQKQIGPINMLSNMPNSPAHGIPSDKIARQLFAADRRGASSPVVTHTNTTVTYSMASGSAKGISTSSCATSGSRGDKHPSGSKNSNKGTPGSIRLLQRPNSITAKTDPQPLPIVTSHNTGSAIPGNPLQQQQQQPSQTPCTIATNAPAEYSIFNNMFSNVAEQLMSKKDDGGERMNFASVAAAGVVPTLASPLSTPSQATPTPPLDSKIDPVLQAKAPGFKSGRTASPQFRQEPEKPLVFNRSFQPPLQNVNDPELARLQSYRNPMGGPSMSPRSNSSTPGGLSPGSRTGTPLELSQHSLSSVSSVSSQKDEYSTPNQPMTLPEIKSTLNPNAPDFQISSNIGPTMNGLPGMGLPHSSPITFQQALQMQMQMQMLGHNMTKTGNFMANPLNQPELQQNIAYLQSLNNQSQGTNSFMSQIPPQGRPSSAPTMASMTGDGPVGPPKVASPMPPCTPPLREPTQNCFDERRAVRPIGVERAQQLSRKLNSNMGPGPMGPSLNKLWEEFNSECNPDWESSTSPLMSAASMSTSVATSSVVTGGNMAYSLNSSRDGRPASTENPVQDLSAYQDSLPMDPTLEHNIQNHALMMQMMPGVMPGQYPMPGVFNPRPGGDGSVPNMWNRGVKPPSPETMDEAWNRWNSQSEMHN